MKHCVLILTDHSNHSAENSLYELAVKMMAHPKTSSVDIASRGNTINDGFFKGETNAKLWATRIDQAFSFQAENHPLSNNYVEIDLESYDLIWLRMPPPLSGAFLNYIDLRCSGSIIINNPKSIEETGSKAFLINFPTICAPMKLCHSLQDINAFRKLHPIVLKPFNEYGGRGIIKIENETVSSGTQQWSFEDFAQMYSENPLDYLAVKFLKNVTQGDKRIVVVNGVILGASVRIPAENSWLCNVAMGGRSQMAAIEPEEEAIIRLINPKLTEKGIVMYGVDTLVNDEGKRVLSEINTTSIGGLPQIAKMKNQPLVEKAIDLIWKYYDDKRKENG